MKFVCLPASPIRQVSPLMQHYITSQQQLNWLSVKLLMISLFICVI